MRACLLLGAWAAAGCGYQMIQADAPFGVRTLQLVPFVEEEPVGLAADLGAALAAALARGGVQLTGDRRTSDGQLTGTIVSENTYKASLEATVPAYEVQLVVHVELRRAGAVVWTTDVSASEAFLPATTDDADTQTLGTEVNRRKALARLAVRLADIIHERLVIASAAKG